MCFQDVTSMMWNSNTQFSSNHWIGLKDILQEPPTNSMVKTMVCNEDVPFETNPFIINMLRVLHNTNVLSVI